MNNNLADGGMSAPTELKAVLTPLWVIFGLAMGPAVTQGLARFAYALLLPAMRTDLDWSFAQAGSLNTINAVGYLVGALIAAPLGRRFGDRSVFAFGLLSTTLAIGLLGAWSNYTMLMILRLLVGFTGALAFIAGAALTSAAATGGSHSRAPTLLGIYFAGAGIGITASAIVVPPLLNAVGWRGGWMILGALAFLATIFGCIVLKTSPAPTYATLKKVDDSWSLWFMAPKLIAYGLFGAGYIAYATFIIAFLHSDRGFADVDISGFWAVLGMSSIAAAFAWGSILGRLKGGWGTALTTGVVAIGAAIPLLWSNPTTAYVSAILFGGSFLSVVAAVTAFVRKAAKPHAWTASIGALTIAFGIGQCIGPILSGFFSDGPQGIRSGLWLSVAILTLASAIAAFQKDTYAD